MIKRERRRPTSRQKPIEKQIEEHSSSKHEDERFFVPPTGNEKLIISTGSTLLDLEIAGKRIYGGGIPAGILVEIFGPPSCGKTVMLCQIAGNIQAKGGELMFRDPEARLNKKFAELFDFQVDNCDYGTIDTVPQLFEPVRKWKPKNINIVNGILADSLAALSTDMELEDGDTMGMRRAKEFSQECRKTCRTITKNNYLMICSNQLRDTSSSYGEKQKPPGGNAIPFYSSLRLKAKGSTKITVKKKYGKREIKKTTGIITDVEVYKSSISDPYGIAPVYIIYDYGVDDIRGNLQYIKDIKQETKYWSGPANMEDAIAEVEGNETGANELRKTVIDLWFEIQELFKPKKTRRPKRHF